MHVTNVTKLFDNPSLSLKILTKLGFGYGGQPLVGSLSQIRKQKQHVQHSWRLHYNRLSVESINKASRSNANITASLRNAAIKASNATIDIDVIIMDAVNRLPESIMKPLITTIEKCIDSKDFKTVERLLNEKIHQHEKQLRKQNIKIHNKAWCNAVLSSPMVHGWTTEKWLDEILRNKDYQIPAIALQQIFQLMEHFDLKNTDDAYLFKLIVVDRLMAAGQFTRAVAKNKTKFRKLLHANGYQFFHTYISEFTLFSRVIDLLRNKLIHIRNMQTWDSTIEKYIKQYKNYYLQCKSNHKKMSNNTHAASNSNCNDNSKLNSKWHCYKCNSINCRDKDDYCNKCNQGVNPLLFPRKNNSNDFFVTKPFWLIRTKVMFLILCFIIAVLLFCACY